MFEYECCKNCSNNPAVNPNASGICCCVLPYLEKYKTPVKNTQNNKTIYWTPDTYSFEIKKDSLDKMKSKYTYRKRPIEIKAIQWTGDNYVDVCIFMGRTALREDNYIIIETLDGKMKASIGDYIIKGIENEFYPCKPDIFEKTYEKV